MSTDNAAQARFIVTALQSPPLHCLSARRGPRSRRDNHKPGVGAAFADRNAPAARVSVT